MDKNAAGEQVGTVKSLYRYPVKSMQGHALEQVRVGPHGLEGDRRYAFVRGDNNTTFPWLTARQIPTMVLYQAYFAEPNRPASSPIRVKTPAGQDLALESDELRHELAQAYGHDIYLTQRDSGIYDDLPVSLLSTASLQSLGYIIGYGTGEGRFRKNVIIDSDDRPGFLEETWEGGYVTFGEGADAVMVEVVKPIERCMMINLHPATADRDPAILRTVARHRDNQYGMHSVVIKTGTIKVGDTVRFRRKDEG